MHRRPSRISQIARAALCAVLLAAAQPAHACTRVVYIGPNDVVMTARTMDWKYDIATNLWIFPRGMSRSGEVGPNSVKWTAKFGSLIASGYDMSTTDGLNEAGLAANVLWLGGSRYPRFDGTKPGLSIAAWAQYVLDNFATVKEAVNALRAEPFIIVTDNLPGEERLTTLHLSMSDATGDSAIIEYLDGKQVIHHGRQLQVLTNSPVPTLQRTLAQYQQTRGKVKLPATNRSADRYVRASFYLKDVPSHTEPASAVESVLGVVRRMSIPYGTTTRGEPASSSTRWRSVADHKRKLYFFESALAPNGFRVDLSKIDFSVETGKVLKLDLGPNQKRRYSGDATADFKEATPFKFKGL
jgi:penicillin V acylase-like amidase (Ntn superfamily)